MYYTIRNISTDEQQTVISFKSNSSCDEVQNQLNYTKIVGNILRGRDVIVVTKQDQLEDLISDSVDASDQNYVRNNATELVSFTPHPESHVEHRATLLKEMPVAVAEDLGTSSEFVYGNLWFLIPQTDTSTRDDVIDDIRKLTPSAWNEVPVLQLEAVASPAMYDGLEILWFKADENILFERFAYKI
ncbi:hypothetical protein O0L34_g3610 [Tuta absoluta]|nr:hypothetical protein O0L34_g3610 [Tuta absoluta]